MRLEDRVCNFELAKQLKDLGVKQESFIRWIYAPFQGSLVVTLALSSEAEKDPSIQSVSAFTVAELGEKLIDEPLAWGGIYFDGLHWVFSEIAPKKLRETKSDTEADALAKLLIYCIKNKLIGEAVEGDKK